MYLSRIQIKNFRNFHDLDVRLGKASVVVGENNVGKSNLGLRSQANPGPTSLRLLKGCCARKISGLVLTEPVKSKEIIEVAIEFQDFQKEQSVFAVLQPFCIPGPVADTARLTYRFRPNSSTPEDRELTIDDYQFVVFGGH